VTCLAEVFQRRRLVDRNRDAPWLVGFELARDAALHDLSSTWPTAAGASIAVGTGPHARAQRWSRAIYESYPAVEGLWCCSSMHADRPAAMLYERAVTALPALPFFHRAIADPLLLLPLKQAVAVLGYGLA
jgi:RES domain